jgi:hypothetical protein
MRVLIACEESQAVCKAFRAKGHEAYSCDIQPCSGGHPEWHYEGDVFEVLQDSQWDLIIAHPPCTYLSVSGARWMYHPDDKHLPTESRRRHPQHPNRLRYQNEAIDFFKALYDADCPRVAVENPVCIMSSKFRKPDQIIQPYMFGDKATKTTCLWLKGLPNLEPTNIVEPEWHHTANGTKYDQWWWDTCLVPVKGGQRAKARSKTFPGIAEAMAEQWGGEVHLHQPELPLTYGGEK